MGHFDISGIWDLQIYWKISIGLFVTWDNWRKLEEMHHNRPLRIPFDTLTPQLYPRTLQNNLRHLKWFPKSPRSGPDHSHTLVRQLESQRVCISIKFLWCWPMYSSCKKAPWDSPVNLKVTGAWNIKMSHTYATFGTLGSLGSGFHAEIDEFTFWQFQMIILYISS